MLVTPNENETWYSSSVSKEKQNEIKNNTDIEQNNSVHLLYIIRFKWNRRHNNNVVGVKYAYAYVIISDVASNGNESMIRYQTTANGHNTGLRATFVF